LNFNFFTNFPVSGTGLWPTLKSNHYCLTLICNVFNKHPSLALPEYTECLAVESASEAYLSLFKIILICVFVTDRQLQTRQTKEQIFLTLDKEHGGAGVAQAV
jgi:hypothetical protein